MARSHRTLEERMDDLERFVEGKDSYWRQAFIEARNERAAIKAKVGAIEAKMTTMATKKDLADLYGKIRKLLIKPAQ